MVEKMRFREGLRIIITGALIQFLLVGFLGIVTEGYTLIGIMKMGSFWSSVTLILGIVIGKLECENDAQEKLLEMIFYGGLVAIFGLLWNLVLILSDIL